MRPIDLVYLVDIHDFLLLVPFHGLNLMKVSKRMKDLILNRLMTFSPFEEEKGARSVSDTCYTLFCYKKMSMLEARSTIPSSACTRQNPKAVHV